MIRFVDGIEKQAAESIANYKNAKQSGGHRGSDDGWDLDNTFGEYFPSYLEYQLVQLCLFYQSEKKFRLPFMSFVGRLKRRRRFLPMAGGWWAIREGEFGWEICRT